MDKLHGLVDAIKMSDHNIHFYFYKENQKKKTLLLLKRKSEKKNPTKNITLASSEKYLTDLFFFFKCNLSRDGHIFYYKFSQ